MSEEKIEPTLTELQNMCEYWQEKLFLLNWTVFVKICNPRETSEWGNNSTGYIHVNETHRTAHLNISSDLSTAKEGNLPWWDHEHLIVHELLHLHFWPFGLQTGTPQQMAEEQAINAITRSLISFKRKS